MTVKSAVLSCCAIVAMTSSAADVRWDVAEISTADWSAWGGPKDAVGILISVLQPAMYPGAWFSRSDGTECVELSATGFAPSDPGLNLSIVSSGDVIDASSVCGSGINYVYANGVDVGGEVVFFGNLVIAYGGEVMLGMSIDCDSVEERKIFGWIEVSSDDVGHLVVSRSALELTGQSMVAGGGAIPEPAGETLFLLGATALLLKRRRKSKRGRS